MRIACRSLRVRFVAAIALAVVCGARPAGGQELTSRRETIAAPDLLSPAVRQQLGADALVVLRGAQRLEFWWSSGLAVAGDAPDWTGVAAGALVGALRLAEPMPDIRGYAIPPGVYTLRFALQPQDGDHLGVSPYRQFLVVAPAAEDQTPEPLGLDRAIDLGKKTQHRSHPAVLSIDPPSSSDAPGAIVRTEEGHRAVVAQVPARHAGSAAGSLTFGLILVGRIEH